MPHLFVIRHAKTVDRTDVDDDFDRYLTERGHADAEATARVLAETGLLADRALVSPARRTRETWAHIASTLGDPPVENPMALYHASTDMLLRAITEAFEDGASSLAVVGHNPGIGGLAREMAARAGTLSRWPDGFPTSSAAIFELTAPASSLTGVTEIRFHNPKL